MSKQTALYDRHLALGASITDFAGWSMPVRYDSDIAEHTAVRTAAGLFDLSHMAEIEIRGPEAGSSLDHALVGTPSRIGIGRARYSMLCDETGGIVDDLVVYRLEEDHFLVVANASNAKVVAEALTERAQDFDATVHDLSDEMALIAVQGPAAASIVGSLADLDVSDLKYYAIDRARIGGFEVNLARTGYTGEDGFEIYCRPADAPAVWDLVLEEGRPDGLVPAGLACRDTLRLEAGMPLYGHELSLDVTPYEAGLGRVVNLDKRDFVGRAALAARSTAGPSAKLVGLRCEGRRSPRAGYLVVEPSTGDPVGRVTSGAPSPTLGYGIAMAYVSPQMAAVGTQLAVDIRGSRTSATVVDLPFYRRRK